MPWVVVLDGHKKQAVRGRPLIENCCSIPLQKKARSLTCSGAGPEQTKGIYGVDLQPAIELAGTRAADLL